MAKPKENDWNFFYSVSFEDKVTVLYHYLCEKGYTMDKINEEFFPNKTVSHNISCITRCYGFEGHNSGIFRNIGATREDVEAFVKKYPQGCDYDGKGTIMKNFLLQRVQQRNNPFNSQSYQQKLSTNTSTKSITSNNWSTYESSFQRTDRRKSFDIGEFLLDVMMVISSKKFWIWILVIIGLIFIFKLCGEIGIFSSLKSSISLIFSNFISSVTATITTFFTNLWNWIKAILYIALVITLIAIMIINFFKNRLWGNLNLLAAGGVFFVIAFYLFSIGSIEMIILSLVFYGFGIWRWQDNV